MAKFVIVCLPNGLRIQQRKVIGYGPPVFYPHTALMLLFFLKGALGFAFGFLFLYGFWRLVARRPLPWDGRAVWFYMGLAFPVFIVGEVLVGHLHTRLFGQPLWQYHIMPIHDGYTSRYNFAIWPLYGWHLYLCEKVLAGARLSPSINRLCHATKHAASGPMLEIVANLGMLLVLGRYYFYYLPDDLWHLTSLQVVPYYTLVSLLFSWVIGQARRIGRQMTLGTAGYLLGVAYIGIG